jgi:hypothetical protein
MRLAHASLEDEKTTEVVFARSDFYENVLKAIEMEQVISNSPEKVA